jgi:hypothetical protein
VSIIQHYEPSAKNQDAEDIEIDFAVLKPETCRALQRFIAKVKSRGAKAVASSQRSKKRSGTSGSSARRCM